MAEGWKWITLKFNAGWSSRCLVPESYQDGDVPILGISSSACSWNASERHERLIAKAPRMLELLDLLADELSRRSGLPSKALLDARALVRDFEE